MGWLWVNHRTRWVLKGEGKGGHEAAGAPPAKGGHEVASTIAGVQSFRRRNGA